MDKLWLADRVAWDCRKVQLEESERTQFKCTFGNEARLQYIAAYPISSNLELPRKLYLNPEIQ